uniref:Periphilin-1-like n=1 Tax=Cynoglossus semilaevis TaxID=244447 RepID=A0A3P8V0T5_CYNSE
MAYRQGRQSIREGYEKHFTAGDTREVTFHRVVNIVDRRHNMPVHGTGCNEHFQDQQWYGPPRNQHGSHNFYSEGCYESNYFDDDPSYGNFFSSSTPSNEDHYKRDDLRYQIESRNKRRPGRNFPRKRQGSGPPGKKFSVAKKSRLDKDYRSSAPVVRDRSPLKSEDRSSATGGSGSNPSTRGGSPDEKKSSSQQQKQNPSVSVLSPSAEETPHSSVCSKDQTPASVAESEEVAVTSMEPKLTPEEDLKSHRWEVIKEKALEIEKHYRQDCETFRTVVKMLVEKEPSLDHVLQTPLDANLLELRQRCLDDLRNFVKELEEEPQKPDASANATAHLVCRHHQSKNKGQLWSFVGIQTTLCPAEVLGPEKDHHM